MSVGSIGTDTSLSMSEVVRRLAELPIGGVCPETDYVALSGWPAHSAIVTQQLREVHDLSSEHLHRSLISASCEPPLGAGHEANARKFPGFNALVLRATHGAFSDLLAGREDDFRTIPVLYDAGLEHLPHYARLGIPRAAILPGVHPYAYARHLTPQQVLARNAKIPFLLLNRCTGRNPIQVQGYAHALGCLGVPAELLDECHQSRLIKREIIAFHRHHTDDVGQHRVAHLYAKLQLSRMRRAELEATESVQDQQTLFTVFRRMAQSVHSPTCTAADSKVAASEVLRLIRVLESGEVPSFGISPEQAPYEIAALRFAESYDAFVLAYQHGIEKIAGFRQGAFDGAVEAISAIHAAPPYVHLNFDHVGNMLIDDEHQLFNYIDLNFRGTRTRGSLEEFLAVVLGRDSFQPWMLVVRPEDRAALRPHLQRIVDMLSESGARHNVGWRRESANVAQFTQMREHFGLRIPAALCVSR